MSGNVLGMVLGLVWRLSQKLQLNPIGPALGEQKIRRGGAWFNGSEDIRVHSRLQGSGRSIWLVGISTCTYSPSKPADWVDLIPVEYDPAENNSSLNINQPLKTGKKT